jgi:hypothetical protein
MDFIPCPGLIPDTGLATVVKGVKTADSGPQTEISGDKFLQTPSYDCVDGSFSSGGQLAGLFQGVIVDLKCEIRRITFSVPRELN